MERIPREIGVRKLRLNRLPEGKHTVGQSVGTQEDALEWNAFRRAQKAEERARLIHEETKELRDAAVNIVQKSSVIPE